MWIFLRVKYLWSQIIVCGSNSIASATRSVSLAWAMTPKNRSLRSSKRQQFLWEKLPLRNPSKLSIERALLKTPARYPYIENLCTSCRVINQSGQNSFVRETIFGSEPYRRITMCIIANAWFRGTLASEPFQYIIFGLTISKISHGSRLPIAWTPVDARNNSRLYHNTLTALGFKNSCNCIQFDDFDYNSVLMFDLTSPQKASKWHTLFHDFT